MLWIQQYALDNTWKKSSPVELEYCDICDKDTEQTEVSGRDAWDSYSYMICHDKGHAEKERLAIAWREDQRQRHLRGEKGTIYEQQTEWK